MGTVFVPTRNTIESVGTKTVPTLPCLASLAVQIIHLTNTP